MTPEEIAAIEADLRTQTASGIRVQVGNSVTTHLPGTQAYEDLIVQMVQGTVDSILRQREEAARIELRRKYRKAMTELDVTVTATNAVTRLTNTRTILR